MMLFWQAHTPPYDIAVSFDTKFVYISARDLPSVWKFHIINSG